MMCSRTEARKHLACMPKRHSIDAVRFASESDTFIVRTTDRPEKVASYITYSLNCESIRVRQRYKCG